MAEIIPDNLLRVMPAKGANKKRFSYLPTDFSINFYTLKKLCIGLAACGCSILAVAQTPKKFNDTTYLKPIEVNIVRAAEKSPFTKNTLNKKDIEQNNLGQDLPIILDGTPNAVTNADAGNGIGYTGIRIRGTDATRINVTINGIPYNDAESQGVFFVNLPDIASSANSIQVQRGVGTSSNGTGAFGATINVATNDINTTFYAASNNSIGSFNTWKNNLQFGSGIINKHFSIDGRLSKISSNGYIDRAATDLQSYFLSTAYIANNSSLRLNIFSGKEKTYQAWNGVSEPLLATNRTYNISGQEQPNKPYDNETDNYKQTHYQIFYNHQLNSNWKTNAALFYTKGTGYYEEYRADQKFANYGLSDYVNESTVIKKSNMIRQLWLDNDFFGSTLSALYKKSTTEFTVSTTYANYNGNHFGIIKWAALQAAVPLNYQWYNLQANKKDFNLCGKWVEQWNNKWQSFFDVQIRNVQYEINGFRKNPTILIHKNYTFINPKIGVVYTNKNWQAYASYAVGSKEPNREDFEASTTKLPLPEHLFNIEIGAEKKSIKFAYSANFYYMKYKNQLTLTGKINDVGAYTRENIANSYRIGIEIQGKMKINNWLQVSGNIALSQNKVLNFNEYIDDYDNGGQIKNNYNKTDIALSPGIVAASTISFFPIKNGEISVINKYVGKQYLDNTSNNNRSIEGYYLQHVKLSYTIQKVFFKETVLILQLNNVFNKKYEANGYTFSYIYGGSQTTESYFYPMAPFNFMFGVNIKLYK